MKAFGDSSQFLASTHKRLSLPIIRRIYKKMIHGIQFDAIKVCDDCIVDGHHRYVSAILAKVTLIEVPSSKTSATIVYPWDDVMFVEEEWDTPEKIHRLNELDAEFNNITLERLITITQ